MAKICSHDVISTSAVQIYWKLFFSETSRMSVCSADVKQTERPQAMQQVGHHWPVSSLSCLALVYAASGGAARWQTRAHIFCGWYRWRVTYGDCCTRTHLLTTYLIVYARWLVRLPPIMVSTNAVCDLWCSDLKSIGEKLRAVHAVPVGTAGCDGLHA